jgi:excisionase family DNA binding protein
VEVSVKQTYVSTAQVAAALGIGVSTVKRWVEDGILPATKTTGGHRKLLMVDVLEVARRSNLPVRDLISLTSNVTNRTSRSASGQSKDLYRVLVSGDASKVRTIIHGAYRNGARIETIADQLIAPAMHRVGDDWKAGRIDVMHEHRGSEICAAALIELKQELENRAPRKRPLAVGGAAEGDLSVLPTLLAQMVLIDAGWDAVNLGPNTPLNSLCQAVREVSPRLVWLSISHQLQKATFLADYCALYRQCEAQAVALVIGGRALSESMRAKIPHTAYGDGLSHLAAFARTIHPLPQRPRRGRPKRA